MCKRLIIRLLCVVFGLFLLCGCEQATSYSKQLEEEERLIDQWLKRNNITLLKEFPQDSLFQNNEMYYFEESIYYQLLEKGTGDDMQAGDVIVLRYRCSTLDENAIVEDYWTTQDRPYPNEIVYGSLVNSCKGWNKAFELMRKSGAHARIIVPSKQGFDDSQVIPYVYEMQIKVLPK
ncbi:MAG: DUF4827 domain-containing protein [Paludibacteraceae bacterium]|nr:DUF4827 domain-containing protein [Paludibacteraceae bacterium]